MRRTTRKYGESPLYLVGVTTISWRPEKDSCSKEMIVDIISEYLPNFEHIETGKSLDGKM